MLHQLNRRSSEMLLTFQHDISVTCTKNMGQNQANNMSDELCWDIGLPIGAEIRKLDRLLQTGLGQTNFIMNAPSNLLKKIQFQHKILVRWQMMEPNDR